MYRVGSGMLYFLDTWISPRWDTKTVIEQEASNIFYEAIISSIKKKKDEREREGKKGRKKGGPGRPSPASQGWPPGGAQLTPSGDVPPFG